MTTILEGVPVGGVRALVAGPLFAVSHTKLYFIYLPEIPKLSSVKIKEEIEIKRKC